MKAWEKLKYLPNNSKKLPNFGLNIIGFELLAESWKNLLYLIATIIHLNAKIFNNSPKCQNANYVIWANVTIPIFSGLVALFVCICMYASLSTVYRLIHPPQLLKIFLS